MHSKQAVELPKAAQVRAAAAAATTRINNVSQMNSVHNPIRSTAAPQTLTLTTTEELLATQDPIPRVWNLPPFCEEPQQPSQQRLVHDVQPSETTKDSMTLPAPNRMDKQPSSDSLSRSNSTSPRGDAHAPIYDTEEALIEALQSQFTTVPKSHQSGSDLSGTGMTRYAISSINATSSSSSEFRLYYDLLNVTGNRPEHSSHSFGDISRIPYHEKKKLLDLKLRLDKVKGKDHQKSLSYEYRIGRILYKHRVQHPLAELYAIEKMRLDNGMNELINEL